MLPPSTCFMPFYLRDSFCKRWGQAAQHAISSEHGSFSLHSLQRAPWSISGLEGLGAINVSCQMGSIQPYLLGARLTPALDICSFLFFNAWARFSLPWSSKWERKKESLGKLQSPTPSSLIVYRGCSKFCFSNLPSPVCVLIVHNSGFIITFPYIV